MKPSEITSYLQNLADDFELQNRHSEAIYLREAAALVAGYVSKQITSCAATLGDQVFAMMTNTTWDEHYCPYIDCDKDGPHRHVRVK